MTSKLLDNVKEQLKEEEGIRQIIVFFVWVIIIAVVTFCEIMYIKIMVIGFPSGLIQVIAIVGAVATGMSVIALYAGKNYWFSGKNQTFAAWAFTLVEIGILVLNVILAFNFDSPQPILQLWKQAYPAAPIVALIGWGLILYLDRTNIMRRTQRKHQEQEHASELAYERLVQKTRLEVKENSLTMLAEKLQAKIESAQHQAGLDVIADQLSNSILKEISGQSLFALKQPNVVEGSVQLPTQQQPPAQTAKLTPEHTFVSVNSDEVKAMIAQAVAEAQKQQTSPLAMPPLPGQQTSGQQNGQK